MDTITHDPQHGWSLLCAEHREGVLQAIRTSDDTAWVEMGRRVTHYCSGCGQHLGDSDQPGAVVWMTETGGQWQASGSHSHQHGCGTINEPAHIDGYVDLSRDVDEQLAEMAALLDIDCRDIADCADHGTMADCAEAHLAALDDIARGWHEPCATAEQCDSAGGTYVCPAGITTWIPLATNGRDVHDWAESSTGWADIPTGAITALATMIDSGDASYAYSPLTVAAIRSAAERRRAGAR